MKIENTDLKDRNTKLENEILFYKNNAGKCKCQTIRENLNGTNIDIFNKEKQESEIMAEGDFNHTRFLQKKLNAQDLQEITVLSRGSSNNNSCFKLGLFTSFLVVVCIIGSFFWTNLFDEESFKVNSGSSNRFLISSLYNDNINKKKARSKTVYIDENISKKGFLESLMYSWYNQPFKPDNYASKDNVADKIKKNNFLGKKKKRRNQNLNFIFSDTCNEAEVIDNAKQNNIENDKNKVKEICIKNQKFLWEAHNSEEKLQSLLNNERKNKNNIVIGMSKQKKAKNKKKDEKKLGAGTSKITDSLMFSNNNITSMMHCPNEE